ncbi:poly(ADP-ribose) glycohydrolase [Neoarius graeffei]|uniref:poly(ADP-ribose) glycohydrolase n=1 Tax=Neoarius graeffei TaxID=443677 RepID=UPI00298CA6FE|nr:poly(ADP-ribose) glycohydrolase [Neoarius graeffei]
MASKNNSSQMRDCLTHSETARESRAGSSRETVPPKQTFGETCSAEPPNLRQKQGTEAWPGNPCDVGKLKREPDCHMQLDRLCANKKHTVLIDINEFYKGKIVPHKNLATRGWDKFHVKLPQDYPPNGKESRWEATKRALTKLKNASAGDVEKAIKTYNQAYSKDWHFDGLHTYVAILPKLENNFSSVISKMARLAVNLPNLIQQPIPLLRQNNPHAITMSQEQISCLLANAFFCTFPHRNTHHPRSEYSNFPTINFSSLFAEGSQRKLQKLRALFHYFSTVTDEATKPDGLVTFERICIPRPEWPEWNRRSENMTNLQVFPNGLIEKEGEGMLQVDFAAKFVGGGVLGRGLVQEEIRFLQCPELIVARLFTEKLADNECLKITGVQMYSKTSGYSDDFEWHSPHKDSTERDEWKRRYCQIVAIDALNFDDPRQQYTEESIKRELLKAYVGFRKDPDIPIEYTPAIATGNWGCGAFKGDPMLKALIQMMAAAVAQRDLAYFTFGNKIQAVDLEKMHGLLKRRKISVDKLYNLLKDYCEHRSRHHGPKNVFDYIREKITGSSQL